MWENSLTVPLTKPHFMVKLDKPMEKILNKVALPLQKRREAAIGQIHPWIYHMMDWEAKTGELPGRLTSIQALSAISPLPQFPISLCDLSK